MKVCPKILQLLPTEVSPINQIILSIVHHLDIQGYKNTLQTCKRIHQTLTLDTAIVRLLIRVYGKSVVYYTFDKHFRLLEKRPLLIERFVRANCAVPRFLGQDIVSSMIVTNCFFGVQGDDITQFEFLSNQLDQKFNDIRELIQVFGFLPCPRLTPSAPFRLLKIAGKDFSFLERLVKEYGLVIDDINDSLLLMLLSNYTPQDEQLLLKLVKLGFQLKPDIIQGHLLNNDLFQVLLQIVPLHLLEECAVQLLAKMLGHLGTFDKQIATQLISIFELSDQCIKGLLFYNYTKDSTKQFPYRTKCFEQVMAVDVWDWVFEGYGPFHEFTEPCFNDLLRWMSEASPFQIQSVNAQTVTNMLLSVWRQNPNLFQPRHLEFVSRMAEIPLWNQSVVQIISHLRHNIKNQYEDDLDYIWIWCIHLKQSLKAFHQFDSQIRTRTFIAKHVIAEMEQAADDGFSILNRVQPVTIDLPSIKLVKFSTLDGSIRFVEKQDTQLLRRFHSYESTKSKSRFKWFTKRRDSIPSGSKIIDFFRDIFM